MSALTGVRVLITRAEGQGAGLAEALEALGAETIQIPAIEIAPPASWCALDAALTTLRAFDWTVFTSPNAVQAFAARGARLGLPVQARRVAVIGPSTGRAVIDAGVATTIDLQPGRFIAEGLAEALTPHVTGASVLLVRAAVARDVLPEALLAAGAQLTIAEAYRNIVPTASVERLRRLFADAPPDVITFTSGSTVVNLAGLLEAAGLTLPPGTALASIGPVTSAALRSQGWPVTIEAPEASVPGLVAAVERWAALRVIEPIY